ncbi:MAG: 2-C-methyl-D-erythritol 2,4-cyclodiphosphate synthase [Rhodothermales bacterium]|nr:2-C-methyl-D-erythritol 2,4-cyclodiphosphate synthase [Rhodothermales bacterium]
MRVGYGYDVHRFAEGRPLILGGLEIEHPVGLQGHSDADVLLHAIIDALLGAASLGDIGQHFPDSAEEWRGADSRHLLRDVVARVAASGFVISNVDSTVIAEKPRLLPYIPRMRSAIAEILEIDVSRVSVKATTSEGLGFVGQGLGMAAHAVCLLEEA